MGFTEITINMIMFFGLLNPLIHANISEGFKELLHNDLVKENRPETSIRNSSGQAVLFKLGVMNIYRKYIKRDVQKAYRSCSMRIMLIKNVYF